MASISLGLAALIGGVASGAGAITSGVLGANAADKAAGQQVSAEQKALDFQKQIWEQEQQNQAPFLQSGQQSIAQLMKAIQSGQFGPGSLPNIPNAPGSFVAPTLEQAQQSPGYQFTQQQGNKGILQGAAAGGGNLTGGTLKALSSFNTGLADKTYSGLFTQALQGYNANLSQYASQLAGFQQAQSAQQQMFQQLLAPAQLGEGSVQSLNQSGQQTANSVGNLMNQIGYAQAAGTVGSTNSINGGINGAVNGLSQSLLLSQLGGLLNSNSGAPSPSIDLGSTLGLSSTQSPYKPPGTPGFSTPLPVPGQGDFVGLGKVA